MGELIPLNLVEIMKTDEYKRYVTMLKTSNNQNPGYDLKHRHDTPYGISTEALSSNFFLHRHYVILDGDNKVLLPPHEYNPGTLEHNHNIRYEEQV